MDDHIRFETLFAAAPVSVQLLAADGRTLRVNKAWEALWQVADGSLLDYVLTQYNILQDAQLEAKGVLKELRRAFAGEAAILPPILYDPAEQGRPGRARWLRARAQPLCDPDGRVREVLLIHEDVSERVQAQNDAALSEMRLKPLANTIPQLVWMAEPDGAIHWYNDRWYAYTGTTPEQMAGWGWQSVHDPAVLPQVVEAWKSSLEHGSPLQMTFPLRGHDGVFRPFFTLVAPLRDPSGRVVQWFGTNTDVSALHEAQRSLRAAEERLRLATLAGGIGIWEWLIGNDRVDWSDEVYTLHGLDRGAASGRLGDVLDRVHPEDRPTLARLIQSAVDERGAFSAEFRVVLPSGDHRWLSTWARVQVDGEGLPYRMVGATISVDAHKRTEAALHDAHRRKDEFLAMLAHELRNPLAPISTAAAMLQDGDLHGDQIRRASAMISRQVRHMTELVDDLLDVSRVTHGQIAIDQSVVDVKAAVANAVEQAHLAIEQRAHELRTVVCAEAATVLGDATRLTQAVTNLLTNAAKYTPVGGHVVLAVAVQPDSVSITVTDDGNGIDAELLPHVFELFTQGRRSWARSEGGLGIGLALVQTIVALHGGRVTAASAGLGAGSSFAITLPRHHAPAPTRPAAVPATPAADRQRFKLMIVDDNLDAAQALEMLLSADGHEVTVAHHAQAALDLVRHGAPDIFILDIGLPDIDGYALAQRLREQVPAARYFALTGYGDPADRARSKAAGFERHLVKPVDADLISRLLSTPAAA